MQEQAPRPSFLDIGLPEGHAFPRLAYHPPTRTILAHTRPKDSHVLPIERLSIRNVKDSQYSAVAQFPPDIAIPSFAINPAAPLLYFLTYRWRERVDGPPAGDWEALYRYALDSRDCEVVLRHGEIEPPEDYEAARVCELLSVADDGGAVFCRVGLRLRQPGQAPVGHYYLSELSLAQKKLALITKLEGVFA
jgi:hypothetical protein